jgi:hypothetical protein
MPVDPWTVLSAAGNIAQFVEYSCKVVLTAKSISKSGATETTTELITITNEVERLSGAIVLDSLDQYSPQLKQLASQCKALAADLLKVLSRLQTEGKRRKWESFLVALKEIWNREKIEQFVKRLDKLQNQLILSMQFLVSYVLHCYLHHLIPDCS